MRIGEIGRIARRWGLLTALALTGCTHPVAPAPTAAAPAPAPVDRATALAQIRTLDPCALYRDTTVADRPLTVLGPTRPLSCQARIGAPAERLEASITLGVALPGDPAKTEAAWVEHHVFDGVEVTSASALDAPNARPREEMVSWSCSFTAHYPDSVRLTVFADSGPHDDACRLGEALIRQAIRAYPERRPVADSRFPATPLTGADPCAVAEDLRAAHRVDINIDEVTATSCGLHLDGGPLVDVSFDYQGAEAVEFLGTPSVRHGHRRFEELSDGIMTVVVGGEFQVGGKPLVPTVTVVELSDNPGLLRLVGDAVADHY